MAEAIVCDVCKTVTINGSRYLTILGHDRVDLCAACGEQVKQYIHRMQKKGVPGTAPKKRRKKGKEKINE